MEAGGCVVKGGASAWVVSTLPDGTVNVRREAAPEQGGDFSISASTLRFFPGRAPAAGERISLTYRRSERSVAHVQDAAALAAAQSVGPAGTLSWAGSVPSASLKSKALGAVTATSRAPRSTADCMAAARALFAFSNAASSGRAGSCSLQLSGTSIAPASIPQIGDRMLVPSTAGAPPLQLPVIRVVLTDEHAVPDMVKCVVDFDQHSANGLSFHVSHTLAADVPQPVPLNNVGALPGLANLQVLNSTASSLQIDAGTSPPNGGGFEVRRRDGNFGAALPGGSEDADLVLRSPVRSFSIPRLSFQERFFVRMYDGSLPPNYSARSAAIVTHLPTS